MASIDSPESSRRILVLGGSSGALGAIAQFMSMLPILDVPVLAVLHLAPGVNAARLLRTIQNQSPWQCEVAGAETRVALPGHFYLAPADHHLLLDGDKILLSKGARENRWRPAVDPLFRSAAVSGGNRVIGIIFSGDLDDGTAGLGAVDRCGGICAVQDPMTADNPSMPRSASIKVPQAEVLEVEEMAEWITTLHGLPLPAGREIPHDLVVETRFSLQQASPPAMEEIGEQSGFICPECSGPLWRINEEHGIRFRCHTGHAFGPLSLGASQSEKLEETLWASLRLLKEKKSLLESIHPSVRGDTTIASRLEEIDGHISTLHDILGRT